MIRDFSEYPKNDKLYTGSEEKIGLTIDGEDYIVKFQKNSESGMLNNHISEHLGSSIFRLLGEEAQLTILGTYQGRNVVLCKDFNHEGETFTPFNGVGESSLERDKVHYQYSYTDIISMLEENTKLTNVQQTIDTFWNMYIIDALIGNFDRHGSNWGFLKKQNHYRIAPMFDHGSSFFPRRNTDSLMMEAMEDEKCRNDMTYLYPTSQIRLNNKKTSYFDVIYSLSFPKCNAALVRMYHRVDLDKVRKFIDSQESLSDIQKQFYQFVFRYRYEHILQKSYRKWLGESHE